ncbi:hypothetical protein [Actinoplanes sp. NPDC020271]|uniref:hypothetical protein n=1 Tax=Actinoplanes sp. NPDC020271 TaxID=3363896 RepID=UPI0037B56B17
MTKEYDTFGPWIDEVRTTADLPRLYRDAGLDPAAFELVLKVPRNIERRNATPGMHLYDALIALDVETLTVLHRRDDTFDAVRVPLDRIVAIEESVQLLDGRLTVHTTDGGALVVNFNGSAKEPIRNLVQLVRQRYLPAFAPEPAEPIGPEPRMGPVDAGLLNDYRRMVAREPRFRLLNSSARQRVVAAAWQERLYRRTWPLHLQASIVGTDDREIVIVHRRNWFTRHGDEVSMARTFLPRARINALSVWRHEHFQGVHEIVAQAGDTVLRFPVAAGPVTEALLAG